MPTEKYNELASGVRFTDALGREWAMLVDYPTIKRLQTSDLDADLSSIGNEESKLYQRLLDDDVFLIDVVSEILTPQIERKGLDATQFAAGMLGVGIQNAIDALMQAIVNFSRPQKGAVIAKAWQKTQSTESLATTRIVERMDQIPIEQILNTQIDSAIDQALMKLSGDSPPSPASPTSTASLSAS